MLLSSLAVLFGLGLLVWSADKFVDGAASSARYLGMPPLLIGMLVVGFGTSVPEMLVSAISALDNNPGLALGNAYGSNITNIGLILGLTAIIKPIQVGSSILRKELPILTGITALAAFQLWDNHLSLWDGLTLLAVFFLLTGWSIRESRNAEVGDEFEAGVQEMLNEQPLTRGMALVWLVVGLLLLILSSRMLVWGAVNIAHAFGVSDLIIGLTIVALGTSLPELASSLAAVRKNEHDIALGNVLGSNLFNTLAVVAIATIIKPMAVDPVVLLRDVSVMGGLTLSLFLIGMGVGGPGRINRFEGMALLGAFVGYSGYLAREVILAAA